MVVEPTDGLLSPLIAPMSTKTGAVTPRAPGAWKCAAIGGSESPLKARFQASRPVSVSMVPKADPEAPGTGTGVGISCA